MVKTFKSVLACTALVALAGCVSSTVPPAGYSELRSYEYQIAGHPFKSEKRCDRKAPVGEFDRKCDVPYAGFNGFEQPNLNISAPDGGSGSGGM